MASRYTLEHVNKADGLRRRDKEREQSKAGEGRECGKFSQIHFFLW